MSKVLRRIRAIFSVYYAMMLEYRAELALWGVATAIPLIMMGVWAQVTAPGSPGSDAAPNGGFPFDSITVVRYFLAVFLVRQLTIVWVIYDFEWHVVSGRLSPLLLQPANPHWRFVIMHFSEQAAKLPFAAAILALGFWLYPSALWGDEQRGLWLPGAGQWAVFLFFCYWAFAMRYLMQNAVAILAFWVERVVAIEQLVFLSYLYLSGLIAPLEAFPDWARELVLLTPFPYAVWLPSMALVGGSAAEGLPYAQAVVVLAAWTAGLALLNRVLWRMGLKHYSAMGA